MKKFYIYGVALFIPLKLISILVDEKHLGKELDGHNCCRLLD